MKHPWEKGRGPKRRGEGKRKWVGLTAAVLLAGSVFLQYGWERERDFPDPERPVKQEEAGAEEAMAPAEGTGEGRESAGDGLLADAGGSREDEDTEQPEDSSAAPESFEEEKTTEAEAEDSTQKEETKPQEEAGAPSDGDGRDENADETKAGGDSGKNGTDESRSGADEAEDSERTEDINGEEGEENPESGGDAVPEQRQYAVSDYGTGDLVEEEAVHALGSDSFFRQSEISDSLFQRIYGKSYKADCIIPREDLRYIRVLYYDFNGNLRYGELISNKAISQDLLEIFKELYNQKYRIEKIRLVDDYDADDDWSSSENNTSCFNYRTVAGKSSLSLHARGLAIDINPRYNPNVFYDESGNVTGCLPANGISYADRTQNFPHKIDENDLCVRLFLERGFTWGGNWTNEPDYMHFSRSAVPET